MGQKLLTYTNGLRNNQVQEEDKRGPGVIGWSKPRSKREKGRRGVTMQESKPVWSKIRGGYGEG